MTTGSLARDAVGHDEHHGVVAAALDQRGDRHAGQAAAAARGGRDVDARHQPGGERDAGLRRDAQLHREQAAARIGRRGDLADARLEAATGVGVDLHAREVAERDLHDLAVGERGAHHLSPIGAAQHQHRLSGRDELALLGEAA